MNLDKLLYRILLGYYYIYIDNEEYKVYYPNLDIKYRAEILYNKIIEDNKFDKRLLTEKEISAYLKVNNIWNPSDQELLDNFKKLIDDTKIQLYMNYTNEKNREKIKKELKSINKQHTKLLTNKNSMNYLGIEDHAISVKNEFIIMNTIYDQHNKLVFNNPKKDHHEYQTLQRFVREIVDCSLDSITLRQLAKSETWRSYASCLIMNKEPLEINDDYRYLIGLHKMYESVRQHHEAPSEEIVNDDDALDGWFLYNAKKAEKEKKKNTILDKVRGNTKNAGEVFIITDDIKEAKDIYDLNDDTSKQNIREIISTAAANKDKAVNWTDLSFVQKDLRKKTQLLQDSKKGK